MKSILTLAAAVSSLAAAAAATSPLDVPVRALELKHSRTYTRLSEGDLEILKDGSLLFVYSRFTGGGGDHATADLVARTSTDGGLTWSDDRMVVEHDTKLNVMSVSLLRLKNGDLALFYVRKVTLTDSRPMMRVSKDDGLTWGEAKYCIPDTNNGYYVLNNDRAFRHSSGRILLPVAKHGLDSKGAIAFPSEPVAVYSDDEGETWQMGRYSPKAVDAEGKPVVLQEPGIFERRCGGLTMWARTDHGAQWWTRSNDRGRTWSRWSPTTLVSPLGPAQIIRLKNGDYFAVWNDHEMFPEMKKKGDAKMCGWRAPLTLGVSKDGGRTWPLRKTLEGNLDGYYCYVAAKEVGDNVVLAYNWGEPLLDQRIAVVPVKWLYTPATEAEKRGFFMD